MDTNAEAFWIQKAGSSADEYEDAFFPDVLATTPQPCSRVAVADGATESSFSGIWARLLVKGFVDHGSGDDDIDALLAEVQPQWAERVGHRELPWYAEEKAQAGAFSSLLGLTLRGGFGTEEPLRWRAAAVGDSCLIQVRGESVITRFPLEHSSQFDSAPLLLPSRPIHNASVRERVLTAHGHAQCDDSFYLMTDALARWFMSEDESAKRPWQVLRDLNTQDQRESFVEMIERLRAVHEIKNDDCTLVRLDIF